MAGKRIAFVPGVYPRRINRPDAVRAARWAQIARRHGLEVEIFGVDPGEERDRWATATDADGLTVTRIGPGEILPSRRLIWQAMQERGPFDGVVVMRASQVGQPAVMCARQWQVPSLLHVVGNDVLIDIYDPAWAPFVTWSLAGATKVTAASAEMAAVAGTLRQDGQAAVWPETVDPERIYPRPVLDPVAKSWNLPPSGLRIGVVSAMQEASGLHEVLVAFGLVRRERPDAQLIFVGNMPQQVGETIEAWRQRDPLSAGRLCWLPELEGDDWLTYLGMLDQAWLPWRRDGFGAGLLQALACEVPVIATAVGANGELLRHRENGWVIPPRDPQALATGALMLAADPGRALAMGAEARRSLPEAVLPAAEEARLLATFREFGWLDGGAQPELVP